MKGRNVGGRGEASGHVEKVEQKRAETRLTSVYPDAPEPHDERDGAKIDRDDGGNRAEGPPNHVMAPDETAPTKEWSERPSKTHIPSMRDRNVVGRGEASGQVEKVEQWGRQTPITDVYPDAAADPDALVPITRLLPEWTPRRVADNCRAGRIPGAIKVGREWRITRARLDAWMAGKASNDAPTVEEAAAELRRRGVL